MTVLGAVVPGTGYLYAGRRWLGWVVLALWAASIGAVGWYFGRDLRNRLTDLAFDTTALKVMALLLGLALLTWAFVVLTSYRLVRPRVRPRSHTAVGYATVVLVLLLGAAPVVRAAQYALVQADLVETVLPDDVRSATTPDVVSAEDPWVGQDRLNVLLLGGDGGEGRTGVRTDTLILVSIDTATGSTVMFSLPRNMMYAQFPEDSPLHDLYPDGFRTDQGDPAFDMLNAVYGQVPVLHPGVLGDSDNEGADAVKQAVSGSLGVPVDYYLLVNLEGFKTIVDAIGGITVNINEPVAINGDTDRGIPPTGYLQPGPDQELDGFEALWFARGRYGSDDYERMDRQRCAVDALIDAADPFTLLTKYTDLAAASKDIVFTDVPRSLGSPLVQLLLKVKDAKIRSVVFRASEQFFSGDPDYDYVRDVVAKAIDPPKKKAKRKAEKPEAVENPVDACAYTGDLVEETDPELVPELVPELLPETEVDTDDLTELTDPGGTTDEDVVASP
jgi:LCP family protein required for cell wall assembly